MYWGQWTATNDPNDLEELKHIIGKLFTLPGMRRTWDSSPLGKVLLDERFVGFVDAILAKEDKNLLQQSTMPTAGTDYSTDDVTTLCL